MPNANSFLDVLTAGAAWAWQTSFAALPAMALLLLLGLWRSFPAQWRLLLAGVVALRLLLPMVPAVAWHPWSAPADPEAMAAQVVDFAVTTETASMVSEESAPIPRTSLPWAQWLAYVWITGVMLTVAWMMLSHWHLRRMIRRHALPADEVVGATLSWGRQRMGLRSHLPVLEVHGLPTMAIWGWLSPRLLVPHDVVQRYSQAEIRGMLLHELAHVRRADALWIWPGLAACALHWFNPFVWLCLRRYLADRELECDRAALNELPDEDRITYGEALLKTLVGHRAWSFATCTPFARSNRHRELQHRLLMIAQPIKSLWGRLAALLTVPLLGLATLTTAADKDEKRPVREEEREREGDAAKTQPREAEAESRESRDGEGAKEGSRDGEGMKKGPRDGEGERKGPRDGEMKRTGPRDGEGQKKEGERDGDGNRDGMRRSPREGDGRTREGEAEARKPSTEDAQAMVITVNAAGDVVNSRGEVIEIKMVRGRMKEIAEQDRNRSIILRGAATTPYAKVLNVLDALKDVGLTNVQFEQVP